MNKHNGFNWNLLFALSYPLVLVFGFFWNSHMKMLGGAAIGGKIENGIFYVKNDNDIFKSVSSFDWNIDLILGCITFPLGVIAVIGLAYFPIKYYFAPLFKKMSQGKKLY